MRLLVINYEMDRLSRTMPWSQQIVNLLAHKCEEVAVLTSALGEYDPPPNVHVEVIPRWPWHIPRRFGSTWLVNLQAYRLARRYRVDACFIHMASGWAYYLKPCFSLLRLPVLMWYAHGTVNQELRRAHRAATRIVTSTPEGFRIPSDKVRVIGQGVDTDTFTLQPLTDDRCDIIAVSRLAPRKRIELLIEVMERLQTLSGGTRLRLKLIGTPITPNDQAYELRLRDRIWQTGLHDRIEFTGYVPWPYIPTYYRSAFLHLNVSQTGSMDKTVVEALACGCPVLTSNEAFFDMLQDYPEFTIRDDRPAAIAAQIMELYRRRDHFDRNALRELIVGQHDVHTYVGKILTNLHEISGR